MDSMVEIVAGAWEVVLRFLDVAYGGQVRRERETEKKVWGLVVTNALMRANTTILRTAGELIWRTERAAREGGAQIDAMHRLQSFRALGGWFWIHMEG